MRSAEKEISRGTNSDFRIHIPRTLRAGSEAVLFDGEVAEDIVSPLSAKADAVWGAV